MDAMQNGNNSTNHKASNVKNVDGRKTWLVVMVAIFAAHIIFNNYSKHGIVKPPHEVFYGVVYFIVRQWWMYFLTIACYFQHILHVYIIETTLAMNITTEIIGMTLHALNVFFLPTIFTILARLEDAHPVISRMIMTYIMYSMTKTWSFAFANSKIRKTSRQNKKHNSASKAKASPLEYPNNVTIRNIFNYFLLTPPIQYQPCLLPKLRLNWMAMLKFGIKQFFVFYLAVSIGIQYLYPELYILRNEKGWKDIINCALNIALPLNMAWLLYCYVSTYVLYLPAYAEFAGMENVVFSKDWWNATDINMFWTKWNVPVHECLKYNVVIPLLRNGYSKMFYKTVAFMLAGLLHEYLNSLPMGIYNGRVFILTLMEIPLGYLSEHIAKRFGSKYGNLSLWTFLICSHTFGMVNYSIQLPYYEIMKT